MTRFAVTLWLTVKGPDHPANFDAVVAQFARLERDSDVVLDCAWSLDDKAAYGDVEVEVTVAADDDAAALRESVALVRSAIHAAGGYTAAWDDAVPEAAVVYRLANEEVAAVDAA